MTRVPVGVLVSGSGSNLGALLHACADPTHPARVAVVISNRPGVGALDKARAAGVPARVEPHRAHADRAAYDAHLARCLQEHGVQWVCLAGFMRLVGPTLLDAFGGRVLNVHPALLPAFPGLHAQSQALQYGARITGATVHLVDAGMDTGPIVAQEAVPVRFDDDLPTLTARILAAEHRLYPEVLRAAVEGRIRVQGRSVEILPRQ